ncbi:MAG: hypothetical protein MMC33_010401 [Icmadophila ericetorum]|nr:hypothetical protein [Icmadophila ericetorum]
MDMFGRTILNKSLNAQRGINNLVDEDAKSKKKELDPEFRAFATRQIRFFVFAGHDSTSSTICHILHLPFINPATLALIRAEHDEVCGKDLEETIFMLEENPQLTKSLLYTTAIIKEALRMFTPAGCSGQGKPNVSFADDSGNI